MTTLGTFKVQYRTKLTSWRRWLLALKENLKSNRKLLEKSVSRLSTYLSSLTSLHGKLWILFFFFCALIFT